MLVKKNMVKPWFSYRFVLFVNHSTFGTLEKNRNHHHWQVWSLAFGASMVLCRWWGRSPGGWDFHHGRQYPIGMDCIFNQGIYHISRFPKSWGYSQILLDHIRPWHRIETTVMTWGSHILRDPPYQYGISMDFTYSRVYCRLYRFLMIFEGWNRPIPVVEECSQFRTLTTGLNEAKVFSCPFRPFCWIAASKNYGIPWNYIYWHFFVSFLDMAVYFQYICIHVLL